MWSRRTKASLLIVVLLASCAPPRRPPVEVKPPPEEAVAREEFLRAKEAFGEGRWAEATRLLKGFLRQYPSTPWTEEALFLLGSAHFALGEHRAAASRLEEFLHRFPRSPWRWEASLRLAQALYELGKTKEALQMAAGLLPEADRHPRLRRELLWLLARGWRKEDPLKALDFYHRLWQEGVKEAKAEALSLIDRLPPEDLKQTAVRWEGTFLEVYARLRLVSHLLDQGLQEEAEAVLREVQQRATEEGFGQLFDALWTRLLKPKERELRIGLLLPLSGRYAQAGRGVLKGAFLAAGFFGQRRPFFRVKFSIRDTASSPLGAEKAFAELKGEVDAIIGPILPQGTKAVLRLLDQGTPPLMPLSPLKGHQDGVWPLIMPVSREVEELVLEARAQGLQTFGLLYPQTPYGRGVVRALQEAVWRWGGEIILYRPYREGETDFSPLFEELEEGGPVPEAILVAGGEYTLCLVASQLAYHDLQGVQLLGLRVSDPEKPLGLCRDYLEGAIYTSPFWPESKREEVRGFVDSFRNAYGDEPDYFSALGWDGVQILLLRGKGGDIGGLYFYGVTGLRSFSPEGLPKGKPFKLRVRHGRVEEIP